MKNKVCFTTLTWLTTLFALSFNLQSTGQAKETSGQAKPFTIIVFPDTQIYAKDDTIWRNSSRKEIYMQMTSWVANQAKLDNIKFVLHMGDIVNEDYEPYQWQNANEAMNLLDGVVPYAFAVGNHDMLPGKPEWIPDSIRNTTNFNQTFPFTRYENRPWYGGRMTKDHFIPKDTYDNSYHFFAEGNIEFMIVSLEVGPTDDMLAWADSLIAEYPTKRVIVMTHSYMHPEDKRDQSDNYLPAGPKNTGEELWEKLIKKHGNIFLVLSGHAGNVSKHKGLLASEGVNGNIVYQLLNGEDYDGWLRILRFVPTENRIYVSTYSPWKPESPSQQLHHYRFSLPGYNRDSCHQYIFSYNLDAGIITGK